MSIEAASEDEVLEKFKTIEQQERADFTLYKAIVGDQEIYVKEFQGAGLWGTISGAIGINVAQNSISGLEIISHNETPGLGARIDQEWFKEQFMGEKIVADGIRMTSREGTGDPNKENGEIDGISGATRTSEAMTRIINEEIEVLFNEINAIGG